MSKSYANVLPKGRFYFEGKKPDLPPEHQLILDPYIGGFLDAEEVAASVADGSFRSGLVGRLVKREGGELWYEIIATQNDLFGECQWGLRPIPKPGRGEITRQLCDQLAYA